MYFFEKFVIIFLLNALSNLQYVSFLILFYYLRTSYSVNYAQKDLTNSRWKKKWKKCKQKKDRYFKKTCIKTPVFKTQGAEVLLYKIINNLCQLKITTYIVHNNQLFLSYLCHEGLETFCRILKVFVGHQTNQE